MIINYILENENDHYGVRRNIDGKEIQVTAETYKFLNHLLSLFACTRFRECCDHLFYTKYRDDARCHKFSIYRSVFNNPERYYISDDTAHINTVVDPFTYRNLRDLEQCGFDYKFHTECWKIVWSDKGEENYDRLLERMKSARKTTEWNGCKCSVKENMFDEETKPCITRVIFNPPATIVFWSDKSKTVAKCSEKDIFNPEVGLAMAILKRSFGADYYQMLRSWIPEDAYPTEKKEPETKEEKDPLTKTVDTLAENWKKESDKKKQDSFSDAMRSIDDISEVLFGEDDKEKD